eukprot:1023343-Prorocentrum_minimum.AAC.1
MLVFADHSGQRLSVHLAFGSAARLEVCKLLGVLVLLVCLGGDNLLHAVHCEAGVGLELGGEDALLLRLLDAQLLEVRQLASELGCCLPIAHGTRNGVVAIVHEDCNGLHVWPSLLAAPRAFLVRGSLQDGAETLLNAPSGSRRHQRGSSGSDKTCLLGRPPTGRSGVACGVGKRRFFGCCDLFPNPPRKFLLPPAVAIYFSCCYFAVGILITTCNPQITLKDHARGLAPCNHQRESKAKRVKGGTIRFTIRRSSQTPSKDRSCSSSSSLTPPSSIASLARARCRAAPDSRSHHSTTPLASQTIGLRHRRIHTRKG